MNWDAIGAVGEIVGALSVLITLIYLATQIRQNTQSVTTATFEAGLAGFNQTIRLIAEDPELASIARRGGEDPTSLSVEEGYRYQFVVRHYTNHVYKVFRLYQRGVYPPSEWKALAVEASQIFATPGPSQFREQNPFYADLWAALAQVTPEHVSDFGFVSQTELDAAEGPAPESRD